MLRTIERFAFKLLTGEFPEQYFARKLQKNHLMQTVLRSQAALERELEQAGFALGKDFVSTFSLTHTEFQCSAEVQNYLKNSPTFSTYLQSLEALKKEAQL